VVRNATALQRLAAVVTLVAGAGAGVVLLVAVLETLPAGLLALLAAAVAVAAAWDAATRRGLRRALGVVAVALALAGIAVVLIWQAVVAELLVVAALVVLALAGAAFALGRTRTGRHALHAPGRPTGTAQHGVLLMNPRSGGGKVTRANLVEEARRRGIEPVVLEPGDDLRTLALDAIGRGAEMLGMAGGDGSQASVAAVAMEHDLPFACIPAGTRNHLALDLGIDRGDLLGALDAYTDGVERQIDLGTLNGHVFVNNVSLGLYAEVVQSEGYRDAKLHTAAARLSELSSPEAHAFGLRFERPDGARRGSAQLLLVSNNPYRLDRLAGLGSRPRLDGGELGIVALRIGGAAQASQFVALELAGHARRFAGWTEWTAATFEVDAPQPVPAGVDGEALVLKPPLRFAIRPGALRVRIARHHPGRSPAALHPGLRAEAGELAQLALHGEQS
jgi:diacylglycerol kinase family enzyme